MRKIYLLVVKRSSDDTSSFHLKFPESFSKTFINLERLKPN